MTASASHTMLSMGRMGSVVAPHVYVIYNYLGKTKACRPTCEGFSHIFSDSPIQVSNAFYFSYVSVSPAHSSSEATPRAILLLNDHSLYESLSLRKDRRAIIIKVHYPRRRRNMFQYASGRAPDDTVIWEGASNERIRSDSAAYKESRSSERVVVAVVGDGNSTPLPILQGPHNTAYSAFRQRVEIL